MEQHSTISPEGLDHAVLVWMQELSPGGICVTDGDLRVRGWNLWMENASRLPRRNVIGRSLLEIFPDLVRRRLDVCYKNALKGEVQILSAVLHKYLFEFPATIPDAAISHMLQTARIAPLVQDGQIVGTITAIEDVTQREHQNALVRKQTERQELFSWALALLLRSSDPEEMVKQLFPRVSALMDVDTYFNYMYGGTTEHLTLHSAVGIPPALKEQMALRKPGEFPCEVASGDRDVFVLSNIQNHTELTIGLAKRIGLKAYVAHPLKAGGRTLGTLSFGSRTRTCFQAEEIEFTGVLAQYVAIAIERFRNLQALHKAKTELSRHAESLEGKVQERTAKLQESINELETFSYSLAHDIRAPLRHIYGYAQLLLAERSSQLSPESTRYVDSIMRAIQNLDQLTRDMLSYTQVTRERVTMTSVDLAAVIKDIVSRNPGLNESGVIDLRPLPKVLGERVLLDQVFSNLLDNALKFIPAGTAPHIVVRSESIGVRSPAQDGKFVRIWVEDNGVGIAPEYHGKIFNLFERLSKNQQGTGIGLAIVAKAITKMEGRVGVESQSGKGSRFWIELQAAE